MKTGTTNGSQGGTLRKTRATLAAFLDSDLVYDFMRSPMAVIGSVVTVAIVFAAVFAPLVAPQNPYDSSSIDLMNSLMPPVWAEGGTGDYLLGTDNQGRDVLSTILYGMRLSLTIAVAAVGFSIIVGTALGLVSAWVGGWVDSAIMRLADIQLSFPAILVAMLIDGVARAILPPMEHAALAMPIVIFAIGIPGWVQYARTVRSIALIEKDKDYVEAARLIGVGPARIVRRHILPNATSAIVVIAMVDVALAVLMEATLSFLGLGMPPTSPSIGTLIRVGNDYLFSGEWWITIFPGVMLAVFVLAMNLLGDWMRDALNPQLR